MSLAGRAHAPGISAEVGSLCHRLMEPMFLQQWLWVPEDVKELTIGGMSRMNHHLDQLGTL